MATEQIVTQAPRFTPIDRREIFDALCDAVDTARRSPASDSWQRAISKAWAWLLEQETYFYNTAAHTLRVPSATQCGVEYTANGSCQCEAFARGNTCWHRAAARLIRRALELQQPADPDAAEVESLAAELFAEAQAAGDIWYTLDIARAGARSRLGELGELAQQWDATSLSARIGTAQAAAMARAA